MKVIKEPADSKSINQMQYFSYYVFYNFIPKYENIILQNILNDFQIRIIAFQKIYSKVQKSTITENVN